MPIYPYRCERCEIAQEVIAKVSDPPPQHCEHCGAEGSMKKLLARTSFQLKGGGWYQQGYEGVSNRSTSSSSESNASSSSGESSSSTSSSSTASNSTSSSSTASSST